VFLKRENIAARYVRLCFINEGLCPREIVTFDLAFGKALVQQGSRRLLDRSEVAGRNQGAKAGLLIGCKSDGHEFILPQMAFARTVQNRQDSPKRA
jgi:hypothetical protein